MEELRVLYKELQERHKLLESRKKTTINEGRIRENILTTIRVQQLLISLVVGRSEQLCDHEFKNNGKGAEICIKCGLPYAINC